MRCLLPVALLISLTSASARGLQGAEPKRPNIIVIMSDDIGYSDLGCYGGEIRTPNLDQLAAGGVRFTQFYNTGRCCPTRAALLTGLYSHQAGIGHMVEDRGSDGYRGDLNRRCITLAEALKPSGYKTYALGKWHVTKGITPEGTKDNWPLQRGFDRYYGTIIGAGNYFDPKMLVRDNQPISAATDPEYSASDYYYTNALSDQAVRFVSEHQTKSAGSPFFMYLAYTAAHWPMHAPESEIAKYRGIYSSGYVPIHSARLAKQRGLGLLDPSWTPAPLLGDWAREPDKAFESRCMEVYAAMVSIMDAGIGRIVAELKRTGELQNTLILYLQDNGGCAELRGRDAKDRQWPGTPESDLAYGEAWANVSNTPFRLYKHWVHEGGIATPLIAHWPAGISASRSGALEPYPAHLIDIMPTLLSVGGSVYPREFDGKPIQPPEGVSLVPALEGKASRDARPLFWEHEGNRAVRVGDWKLVWKHPGPWELYNIKADRTESHDLSGLDPDRVAKLKSLWQEWADRVGVRPWPLPPRPAAQQKAAAGGN